MSIPSGLSHSLLSDTNFSRTIQANTDNLTIGDLHCQVGGFVTKQCVHNKFGDCRRGWECFFEHNYTGQISDDLKMAYINIRNRFVQMKRDTELHQVQTKSDIEDALTKSQAQIRKLESVLNDAEEHIKFQKHEWNEAEKYIKDLERELISARALIQTKDQLQSFLLQQINQTRQISEVQDIDNESNKRPRYN